jgi:hypothetical protein
LIADIATKVRNHLVHKGGIASGEEPRTFTPHITRLTLIAENDGLYEKAISKHTLPELQGLMAKRKESKS